MTVTQRPSIVEGKLYARLGRFSQTIALGLIWTAVAATIVLLYPATAALFSVVRHWNRGDDPPLLATFWAGLKENFVQAIQLQVIGTGTFIGLALTVGFVRGLPQSDQPLALVPLYAAALVLAAITLFIFPLMVNFRITTVGLMRTALLIAIARPLTTLRCLAPIAALALLSLLLPVVPLIAAGLAASTIYRPCQRVFDHLAGNRNLVTP